jgi:hypothetical protein
MPPNNYDCSDGIDDDEVDDVAVKGVPISSDASN